MTLALATEKIQAGDGRAGLEILDRLAHDETARLEALGHRAWYYLGTGQLELALADYDVLVAANPGDTNAAAARAETLRQVGRPAQALKEAGRVLGLAPQNALATAVILQCRRALDLPALPLKPSYRFPNDGQPATVRHPAKRFPLFRKLRDKWRFPSRYDYYEDYLRRHASGRRVIDIGAMWLVDGRFSFFAEQCGAREVVAFDTLPPSRAFEDERRRRGSAVRYVQGDLMNEDNASTLGTFDVVFCCGVLYHLPDPALGLLRIRQLASRHVLIGTATISEGLSLNRAVYYPYMDGLSRRRWNFKTNSAKIALDVPYTPPLGYENWTWGLAPSCVASMAQSVGFEVERLHYRRNFTYFECTAATGPFALYD